LQEVDPDDITDEHKELLEKTKRMLLATGAELNLPGAGPVSHSSAVATGAQAGALLLSLVQVEVP
jgi:hypothetical protein